ncbi:MAG: PAS domain S-box protein [Acidobacteriales bacterium]|nr:PAS domain S-box protein [Candidatus Koribacter versatilis]MBI3646815.1 PAS domain S-box protein [Terriglobales bacterium]
MPEQGNTPNRPEPAPSQLEREENQLWRWALGLLVLLATAVAVLSWEQLKNLPYRLWAIPVGLLILAVLFAVYAFGRRREVGELKYLLKNLQDRAGVMPSDQQLDQLTQMIARSQRNFKELIDSLDDAALAISLDGTLRTVNRRVTEVLGVPYSDIVGHKLEEFLSTDLRAESEASLSRFLEKRHWAGVVEIQLKSGTRPSYYDCVVNAIIKSDEVVGASVLARDITEQREKERRFTQLFETLQEGVYFATPEGSLLDVNPALVKMLGYRSKEELLSLPPAGLNVEADTEPVLGRTGSQSGSTRTREIRVKRKDGSVAVCVDTSTGVMDAGRIVRYQGTLVDVTEKRAMERQLRRQEEFRRHLLESFPDLILVLDLKESYTFVSSRIRDLLGYGPELLLGKKIEEVEENSPELVTLYRSVANGQNSLASSEYGARHQDGNWRTMLGTASPLLDTEGKPAGVIISVRDVTMEKKLEQQVIQSERLAAMGQMIGGFAHELNNPLTGILGMTELLQESETSEANRKQLGTLQQQARRAAEIVQNLQYFARPPAPGRSPVNLSELIQRTLHLQAYPLRKSNITVDFLQEPALPPVMADPNQLMQVFLNLILNADQAIREGRDKGTIRIRLGRNPDSVWVMFQDDGPGIAPEVLPHIFDPFFTTKRPGRGTGLGLSICKTLLREHGGNIEAATAQGGGAVFTITLPVTGAGPGAAK